MKVLGDWRLLLYNVLLIVLSPYILWRKLRRARSRRTTHEFDLRRWPFYAALEYSKPSESRKHIVLLCTGMGEARIAAELTRRLQKRKSDLNVTWAIRRRDVEKWAREKYPQQNTIPFPFDFLWPCLAWLRALKPDVLVSIERLWWPNLLWCARRFGVKTVAVAGTEFAREKNFGWTGINRWTLRAFDKICLQSEAEKEKLAPLLPTGNVFLTGALKWFEAEQTSDEWESDAQKFDALKNWLQLNNRPLIVAGSTHEGEEEFVLNAFGIARRKADCCLLLAPRQLHRAQNIAHICREAGRQVKLRSQPDDEMQADIFLLDSMGELASAYRFASAAFIGGTLRGAGHNVFEPLVFQVPVAFGNGGKNRAPTAMQTEIINAGLGQRVESARELAEFWLEILENSQQNRSARFETFREKQLAAWDENVAAILEFV